MLYERQISIWRLYFIKRALSESESDENEQEKEKSDAETGDGDTTSASHPPPDPAQFRSASPHSYSLVVRRTKLLVSVLINALIAFLLPNLSIFRLRRIPNVSSFAFMMLNFMLHLYFYCNYVFNYASHAESPA